MNFLIGLITIWIAWQVVQFIWYFAEGIDQELDQSITRKYTGPIMREIVPKKNKKLFDRR